MDSGGQKTPESSAKAQGVHMVMESCPDSRANGRVGHTHWGHCPVAGQHVYERL